jgi:hypothetical protein
LDTAHRTFVDEARRTEEQLEGRAGKLHTDRVKARTRLVKHA